jgi:hypothetical protein
MKLIRILIVTLLATFVVATPVAAANDPVRLNFQKSIVDPAGVWQGTVSGDVDGDLTTELQSLAVSGPIWRVTFAWIVSADSKSFVATLDGTLNTRTGTVVMDGSVTEGWLLGARVHEQGRLVDPATSTFVGTIRIEPATS